MKAFVLIALLFMAATAAAQSNDYSKFGDSVTMHLSFVVSGSRDGDTLTPRRHFALAEDAGDAVALISKNAFGTNVSQDAYDHLYLRQPQDSNYFMIAVTKASPSLAEERLAESGNIFAKTLRRDQVEAPLDFPVFLRLEYNKIRFVERLRWPEGLNTLVVLSQGKESGLQRISIELIK